MDDPSVFLAKLKREAKVSIAALVSLHIDNPKNAGDTAMLIDKIVESIIQAATLQVAISQKEAIDRAQNANK